jgi:hypothetical protein
MNQQYELTVTLSIRGPFITGTGTDAARGLDLIFARDLHGKVLIHSSHVKGKFREAVTSLKAAGKSASLKLLPDFDIEEYLGKEDQKRGKLLFHDFALEDTEDCSLPGRSTRVKIDTQTGTAEENALITVEHLFRTGSLSVWKGTITFFAPDSKTAGQIRDNVLQGFKWITNFGAIKGDGYGRLEKVAVDLLPLTGKPAVQIDAPQIEQTKAPQSDVVTLCFEFHDNLFIGGIVKRTNYKESQQVIPGAVIKGAFARFLNELCGADETAPITEENELVNHDRAFPRLAKYFSRIRFSHAFPAHYTTQRRPVAIPFSTVQNSKGEVWDLALQGAMPDPEQDASQQIIRADPALLVPDEKAPLYQIDWKTSADLPARFGWATCQIVNTTRTAIEPQTRTAAEEQLYTFQYISPYEIAPGEGSSKSRLKRIRWLATIRLPETENDADGKPIDAQDLCQLRAELHRVLQAGWDCLGKRDARFRLTVLSGDIARHASSPAGMLVNNRAIVVLQTDALLFDGYTAAFEKKNNLRAIYEGYWAEATKQTCELVTYFARQRMDGGGYLAKVRQKRTVPDYTYYPYILTEAGSVFVLQVKNPEQDGAIAEAHNRLQQLEKEGLPFLQDVQEHVQEQMKQTHKELWQVCPFVPENGFGEICINLAWHWEKAFPALKGGEQHEHHES